MMQQFINLPLPVRRDYADPTQPVVNEEQIDEMGSFLVASIDAALGGSAWRTAAGSVARAIHIALNLIYNPATHRYDGNFLQTAGSVAIGDLIIFATPTSIPSNAMQAVLSLPVGGVDIDFPVAADFSLIANNELLPNTLYWGRVYAGFSIQLLNRPGGGAIDRRATLNIANAELQALPRTTILLVDNADRHLVAGTIRTVKTGSGVSADEFNFPSFKVIAGWAASPNPSQGEILGAEIGDLPARTRIGQHVPGREVSGSAPEVSRYFELPVFSGADRYLVFGIDVRAGEAAIARISTNAGTIPPENNDPPATATGMTVEREGTTYAIYVSDSAWAAADYSAGGVRIQRLHGPGADTWDRYGEFNLVLAPSSDIPNAETSFRGVLIKRYGMTALRRSNAYQTFNINSPSTSVNIPQGYGLYFTARLGIFESETYWNAGFHEIVLNYLRDLTPDLTLDFAITYNLHDA